jgi:glycine cleavage system H protein
VGSSIEKQADVAVVESVKAASDVYSPVSGEIIATNENLENAPETVNSSPYDDGWFFKIKPTNIDEVSDLLDAEAYKQLSE